MFLLKTLKLLVDGSKLTISMLGEYKLRKWSKYLYLHQCPKKFSFIKFINPVSFRLTCKK